MEQVVKALQSVTSLPLQLDSSNVEALARGLWVYNGKPIVNSTNGEPEKACRHPAAVQEVRCRHRGTGYR